MANITASININAVTYAAGESLVINSSGSNNYIRLTIDAQNPADVAKIEGTLIGNVTFSGLGEFYVVNTSTTTPLIIKLNSQNNDLLTGGYASNYKVRGDWISIGTGTGALGQTVSTVIGGKSIDWPPFVQVETAAGSGQYVTYINIGGNYMNDASAVPAAYRTFADVGTNELLGAFFEYDELNRSIKFATATGGYPPPAGANIRIPNIHFTASGVPNATVANRSMLTIQGAGNLDFDTCMFSNRFAGQYTQYWNARFRNTNIPGGTNTSQIQGDLYLENVCGNPEIYAGGGFGGFGTVPRGSQYIRNVKWVQTGASQCTLNVGRNADIDGVYAYVFARSVNYSFALPVSALATDTTRKSLKNIFSLGGRVSFSGLNNAVVDGVYHSDTVTGLKVTTNAISAFAIGSNNRNSTFRNLKRAPGGAPNYGDVITIDTNYGLAIHDLVYDCENHSNRGLVSQGQSERLWLSNITITNTRTANTSTFDGQPNGLTLNKTRLANISGSSSLAAASTQHVLVNRASGSPGIAGLNFDIDLLHTTRVAGGTTGGFLTFGFCAEQYKKTTQYISGVRGVDYYITQAGIFVFSAGVELIFESQYPAIGVTSLAGCSVAAFSANITIQFKIKTAAAGSEFPSYWTTLTAANLISEFDALANYSAVEGFHAQVRVVSTGAASLGGLNVSGVTLSPVANIVDVGFIDVGTVAGVDGSKFAFIDTRTNKITGFTPIGPSGTANIDVPYEFNSGAALPFKAVCRKAGFFESVSSGNAYQDGLSLPVTVTAGYPAIEAQVAGISVDGVAKTITVTGTKTFAEIYQHSQWWSVQPGNFIYDVPMTSQNGDVFSMLATWKLLGSVPTAKTLSGGWVVLTAGTHTINLQGTKVECSTAGTYEFGNATLSGTIEFINTSGGAVIVNVPAGTIYTNTGPNITVNVAVDQAEALISGIVAGSRLQIYNVTTATEMVNAINATTSYTLGYPNGTGYSAGDVVRVRLTYCTGLTAKLPVEYVTIASAAGWSILANQQDDEVYIANGIDGSTVTEYSSDYVNVQIDVSDPDGVTSIQRGYAWYCDQMTGDDGIRYFYGAFQAEDAFNYLLNTDVADIKIQNTGTAGVTLTGGAVRRKDGSSPIAPGGSVYIYYGRTYGLETGTSGLTPTEADKLLSLPDAAGVWSHPTRTLTSGGGTAPTAAENADAVLAALNAATIPVDVQKMNGAEVIGDGSVADPWRGVGVPV